MISPLLGLILLVQGTTVQNAAPASTAPIHLKDAVRDFPRSMLQPKVSGPISIDLTTSSRASYQALADIAGLNILFDPDFRDGSLTPVHLDNTDIYEAFDRVSAATGSFVEVLDTKTILVSPNNATKRRDYEPQVIKTIYLTNARAPQDISRVVTALRTTVGLRFLAMYSAASAIVIKDTPDKVGAAEKLVAELDKISSSQPIAVDSAGNLFVPDGTSAKKSSPERAQLQVGSTGSMSIDSNDDARTTFQSLAAKAGLNLLFDQDFRSPASVPFKLENVNVLDALDLLGYETRTFWEPVGSKTILIAPDNQTKRRDYDQLVLKTIYLGSSVTQSQITEIVTVLRTLLNIRYLAQVSGPHAIAVMETPTRIVLAEKIMTDLGVASTGTGITLAVGDETGGLLRTRVVRSMLPAVSQLNLKGTATISVDLNGTIRESFERIAGMAGLHVTFDERFKDSPAQPFSVSDVSVLDALDFLSLQSRTFWEVLDSTTILVAPDSQTARRDLEPKTERVIHLRNTPTEGGAREIVIALRTLLNVRQIETADKAIVLSDNFDRMTLAEKIVTDLDR